MWFQLLLSIYQAFLLCQSLSCVQLFVTPWTVGNQAPLVHGIFQARILEWVAIYFSRGIVPTQGLNPSSPASREILYHLSHPGSPIKLFSSVQFSCSVVSDSLRLHELQHTRPPCPSPTPGVHSNSHASSQ